MSRRLPKTVRARGVHNCRLHVASELEISAISQVPWSAVVLVDVLTEKDITCPICMDSPCFPRITQCGHVYCLPCLIRFRQALGNSCAICADFILDKELRPCRVQLTPTATSGSLVNFVLAEVDSRGLALPAGVVPVGGGLPSQSTPGWWLSALVRVTFVELSRHLHRELKELERRLDQELYLDDEEAAGLIIAHEELLNECKSLPKVAVPVIEYSAVLEIDEQIVSSLLAEISSRPFAADKNKTYLYQCGAGSAVFLDPLWSRALLTEYGDQDWARAHQMPRNLELVITKAESVGVDDTARRRFRCIAHLPEGDSAIVCDVDVDGMLSTCTRSLLAKALERREREKVERELQDQRDEERRRQYEAKAAKETLKLFNVLREPQLLPKPEDFVPLPRSSSSRSAPQASGDSTILVEDSDSSPTNRNSNSVSPNLTFAQIAARPPSDLPREAGLIESFIQSEVSASTNSTSTKKNKKKTVFRLAG